MDPFDDRRGEDGDGPEGDAYAGQGFEDDPEEYAGGGSDYDENDEEDDDDDGAPLFAEDSDDDSDASSSSSSGSSSGSGDGAADDDAGDVADGDAEEYARSAHASERARGLAALRRLRRPVRRHGFPGPDSEEGRERVRVVFEIPPEARRTAAVLPDTEYARVLTERVADLGRNGGTGYLSEAELAAIPTAGGAPTALAIAAYEVALKKCPFSVQRICERTGLVEMVPVNDLFYPWPPEKAAEAVREY